MSIPSLVLFYQHFHVLTFSTLASLNRNLTLNSMPRNAHIKLVSRQKMQFA